MKGNKKFVIGMLAGMVLMLLLGFGTILVVQQRYLSYQLDQNLITGNSGGNTQNGNAQSGEGTGDEGTGNAIAGLQGELDWDNIENKL